MHNKEPIKFSAHKDARSSPGHMVTSWNVVTVKIISNITRSMKRVLRENRIPPHANGNIHKVIIQPAMLFGMETVSTTSSHVKKLQVTEMKMCRWARGHTLRDHLRNDDISGRL